MSPLLSNESTWTGVAAGFAWKSAVIWIIAWLTSIALRKKSAAARHLVWTAAAVAVLALPLAAFLLPALRWPRWAELPAAAVPLFHVTSAIGSALSENRDQAVSLPNGHALGTYPNWRVIAILAWGCGTALGILQMLLAFFSLVRTRRAARPSPDSELGGNLARELGIRHKVDVLAATAATMPMASGLIRPVVLLPASSAAWSLDRRRVVLLHELAHIRRGDISARVLARCALVLHWWNPLAWMAWRKSLEESERAADDFVLSLGERPSEYAAHLLDVAKIARVSAGQAWAAVAMARPAQLEKRITAILDSTLSRSRAGRAHGLLAALAVVAITAPFAAVRAQDSPADLDVMFRLASAQGNPEILEKPASILESAGQYGNAKKLLEDALAIRAQVFGKQSVEYGMGLLRLAELEERRHADDSVELYTQAAQLIGSRTEAVPVLVYLGVNQIKQKNYAGAIDYFQQIQNLEPAEAGLSAMWMGVARERAEDPSGAEALYRSALAVENGDTDQAATTMELLANLLNSENRTDEAKELSGRATSVRRALGAEQATSPSGSVRMGPGILAPTVLYKVEPQYTDEARAAKYQGTVLLTVDVEPDGVAHNIRATRGLGLGLTQSALDAVRQWRFHPATRDGAPLAVQASIEVNFRLL